MAVSSVWCVSSLRVTRTVGSVSMTRARNVPSLSSSFLFSASMATGYCGTGSGSGSMATVPERDKVSPVLVSVSLGMTTMSPALALFTSLFSLPIIT